MILPPVPSAFFIPNNQLQLACTGKRMQKLSIFLGSKLLVYDLFKLYYVKTIAYDKFNEAKILMSVFDRAENIVGKGENAGF